jgi:hypothetical protein
MRNPVAYTYEADTHCPGCTLERFGHEVVCRTCGEAAPHRGSVRGEVHRWGPTTHPFAPKVLDFPPEAARDREGNGIGALAPWDDWCDDDADRDWSPDPADRWLEVATCTLACGTCRESITVHTHRRAIMLEA